MTLSPSDRVDLRQRANVLFSPRTPISSTDLFAGRGAQILKTIDAISQPGAHGIIYGERGVGKTSLANVSALSFHLERPGSVVAPRVNCDATDDFTALWSKVFSNIHRTTMRNRVGFLQQPTSETRSLMDEIGPRALDPGFVQRVLSDTGKQCSLVVILDEFDRLPEGRDTRLVADTLKSLSDSDAPVTILIVGVGDSVANLVRGHESVKRHLIEVPLPRMRRKELEKIITDRIPKLQMTITANANKLISLLSRGLPYYAHLLGRHSACVAISKRNTEITEAHVHAAMHEAIDVSEREMRRAYYEATKSRQPGSRYAHTLTACALAEKDEFGYFSAADVREPLSNIMGEPSSISKYNGHLHRFAEKKNGGVLQVVGERHQRRFRFSDPLMEPFIVIKGLAETTITHEHLKFLATNEPESH